MTLSQYKNLAIEDFVGSPHEREIAAIEKKLGATLPEQFVSFLKVANGGVLDYLVDIPTKQGVEIMSFCWLYGTRNEDGDHESFDTLLYELELERREKGLPNQVLPFARDTGASVLYLDLSEKGQGRVLAYIDGLPEDEMNPEDIPYVVVAPDLDDFLSKLYLDVDEQRDMYEEALEDGDDERLVALIEFWQISMPDWKKKFGITES